MRFYIVRRPHGLAVTTTEPPMDIYVEGPFLDREDAFERMQEINRMAARRDATWEVFSGICLMAGLLLLLMLWMSGGEF